MLHSIHQRELETRIQRKQKQNIDTDRYRTCVCNPWHVTGLEQLLVPRIITPSQWHQHNNNNNNNMND